MVRTTAKTSAASASASKKSKTAAQKQVKVVEPVEQVVEEQSEDVEPKPVVKKGLIKKEPPVIRLDDGFTAGSIVNVLKSYYREHPVIDGQRKRTVNIHLSTDPSAANTVDLLDYKGLFAFIQAYIKHHQIPLDVRNAEEVPVPFSMSEVINAIPDMRLRGALHIADTSKGKGNTEEMKAFMENEVLPDLGFHHGSATTLADYHQALIDFIHNDNKIKTKIYNQHTRRRRRRSRSAATENNHE